MHHHTTLARTLTKISRARAAPQVDRLRAEIDDKLRCVDSACHESAEHLGRALARLRDYEERNAPDEILAMARANRDRWADAHYKLTAQQRELAELRSRTMRAACRLARAVHRPRVRVVQVRQRCSRRARTVARVAAKTSSTGDPDPEPDSSARASSSGGAS